MVCTKSDTSDMFPRRITGGSNSPELIGDRVGRPPPRRIREEGENRALASIANKVASP
jgi:hypothetical protein